MKIKYPVFVSLLGAACAFAVPEEELATVPATEVVPAVAEPPSVLPVVDLEKKNAEEAKAKSAAAEKAKADAEAEEKKRKEEEAKLKKERLDKIKKLKFDRTVSKILGTWAPKAESEEKEEADDEAEKPEPDPFDESLKHLQRDVALGKWGEVKAFLFEMEESEGKALYAQMLKSLQSATPAAIPDLDPVFAQMVARVRIEGQSPERSVFTFDDVLGLISCAPHGFDDELIRYLGGALRTTIEAGNLIDDFLVRLESEKPLKKLDTAKLLKAASQTTKMGAFLPSIDEAVKENQFEALNLLSDYYLARYRDDDESEDLKQAWEVTQAVLASPGVGPDDKETALKQAVSLSGRVDEELGENWLKESFESKPERGMEVLRVIGSAPATNLRSRPTDTSSRLKGLELQSTAVESLIKVAPEQAKNWRETINLLAMSWLKEAEISRRLDTTSSRRPGVRRDRYGNFYYMEEQSSQVRNRVQPIKTGDLLEVRPSAEWLALLDDSLQAKFDMISAQLFLKVNEEDEAFPYVEKVTKAHPDLGEQLVNEFLRVWTSNHDPNARRSRSNYYSSYYGYERKAETIPLTRSKQERNLKELSAVVKRLRALPLEDLDEKLLVRAFTTCHSSAEVYRVEAIERVFGSVDNLEGETLAELTQQMRRNLAGLWRKPDVQKGSKTKRSQRDMQAEVLRGYQVCNTVLDSALRKYPKEWTLHLAKAAIEHDENNYEKELSQNSGYAEKREESLDAFASAARFYAESAGDRDEDEEDAEVFQQWFYASLGATDLSQVDDDMVSAHKEPAKIKEAMAALPGGAADRHFAKFAQSLFTRMSSVKPAVKHRYLRAGFEVVGDHEDAAEAKSVFDYYKDLVTEIRLVAEIDGSSTVGREPFGMFVSLRHTKEIERESGGFGRYLQNQNSGQNYYYNYGRPLENYRDKFEEVVRESLGEQFEVLGVTFQSEDVKSKAIEQYGWRVTPYAYLLLKAKGPEVDQIPSVRLDLDFLDTSGYAVLPVETSLVPIDASGSGGTRPVENLKLTQTLDERQSADGKLILEISASAQGLVPALDDILDISPTGFEVTESEDQGLSLSRFDPDADDTVVVSERNWLVTMKAEDGLSELPKEFSFGKPKLETAEAVYQRYVDADLAVVEPTISLEEQYGKVSNAWVWLLLGFIAVAVGGWVVYRKTKPETVTEEESRYQVPETVTPFTVIGLLKDIQENNGFNARAKKELGSSISRLEAFYFSDSSEPEPDLAGIANDWVKRAR